MDINNSEVSLDSSTLPKEVFTTSWLSISTSDSESGMKEDGVYVGKKEKKIAKYGFW